MTDEGEAYSPLSSSKSTVAVYANPFGFSLQAIDAAEDIIISSNGGDVASVGSSSRSLTNVCSTFITAHRAQSASFQWHLDGK